jgi:hypothetical protein
MNKEIFIKGNVPSLKNGQVISNKKGKIRVSHSPQVNEYLRSFGIAHFSSKNKTIECFKTIPFTFPLAELKEMFDNISFPATIGFHFIRESKHRWDFHNATQIIFDLFTALELIPDDSMNYVIPECLWIDNKHYSYNKENPGVIIKIINK